MTLTSFSRSLHYKDSKNEPCVHSISWINRWNLTKLAQIHHWDWGKKWLDFGDLDLIFKVTPALWNSNFDRKELVCTLSLEPMVEFYQTSTDTLLGQGKEVIRFWWPRPYFQGHYIIKTLKMSFVCTLMSWINRCHCDGGKQWLDFGYLDLIFKVTPALWNSNFDRKKLVCTLSLEPMARIWPN